MGGGVHGCQGVLVRHCSLCWAGCGCREMPRAGGEGERGWRSCAEGCSEGGWVMPGSQVG